MKPLIKSIHLYYLLLVFVLSVLGSGFISLNFNKEKLKPNVILILTDDQGWGDLSLHGNTFLETPNLDQMAREGLQINNFYVSPLCAPTRASLLTGRYHLNTGVVSVSKGLEIMDTAETTLAEVFKANGYATGIYGKWHNGEHFPNRPNDQGFDDFFGFCAGHWSNYFDTELEHNSQKEKTVGFITDVLTEKALKFIDKNKNKPFFCYIPFNAPHSPFQVPDRYFNKYKAKGLDDELSSIYGMLENVDDNVARIFAFLKEENLEENTIVIFMTDNGPNSVRFNGQLKGIKGSVNEGGVKVPFFIKWKNQIQKNSVLVNRIAAHIDVFPTLIDLCDLKKIPTKKIHGVSLAKEILEPKTDIKTDRNIFTHVNFMSLPVEPISGGFRNEQYRFVYEKDINKLYNLSKDPYQLNDIGLSNPQLLKDYTTIYTNWLSQSLINFNSERKIVLSKQGVFLPAYEANLSEGIKFKEGHGWAHDWIASWNSPNDVFYWEIDCAESGKYKLEMDYLCYETDIGSIIACSVGNEYKEVKIEKSKMSKIVKSPDRIKRKEAYEIETWGSISFGDFNIPKGQNKVLIKGIILAKDNFAEVKGLNISYK